MGTRTLLYRMQCAPAGLCSRMQAFTEVVPRGFAKVAGKIEFYLHGQAGFVGLHFC
jgi:hypothetical protein